jgi:hypothetical protein
MNKHNLIVILFLIAIPKISYAWVPCMPFCDAGCGGAALQAMGVSITSAMQAQGSANQQLLSAINDLTQTNVEFGTDLADRWTSSTMDILSALDARTNKLELAQTMQIKEREFSTDAFNNVFVQTLREKYVAGKVSENNKIFSKTAMPETGDVEAKAASKLKEAVFKSRELANEVSLKQEQYNTELKSMDSTYATNIKTTTEEDVFKGQIIVCARTMSPDELNNMQTLITYLINPNPLPTFDKNQLSSPDAQRYELDRKSHNAKVAWISGIVNQVVSNKAQFVSSEWIQSYVSRRSDEPELSLSETLFSLVEGRVTSEGWYLDGKSLSEPGLQRELTFLKNEENALLYLLSERREWANQLISMILIEKMNKSVKELNGYDL